MNINDYKDGNGNVEVSETLVGDLIDGVNAIEESFNDVADYVVETGGNANGSWEKWNSGKLVQKVNPTISVPINVAELEAYRSDLITINYPISSLTVPKIYGLTCNALAYLSLEYTYNDRISVYFLAFRNTRTVTYVSFESIGTWK